MTTRTTAAITLMQQAYIDSAAALDGFGEMGLQATAADVAKAHALWASIPADERHLSALCFHQFDAQRDLFGGSPEAAVEAPSADT